MERSACWAELLKFGNSDEVSSENGPLILCEDVCKKGSE
jgi:hypothetical protein